MKTIELFVFLIAIVLSFFLFCDTDLAYGDNQKFFDCTNWTAEMPPHPLHFIENHALSFESADLRVAGYRNPEREKQVCVRYFLKSTGQTLWQVWTDTDDVPMSAVLFGDDYVAQPHTHIKLRVKSRIGFLLQLEVGIFTNQGLDEPTTNRTFVVVLTNSQRLMFF